MTRVPDAWYNVLPDLHFELPDDAVSPNEHSNLSFDVPETLLDQATSREPRVAIPTEVLQRYRQWRPTSLRRACAFERTLGTRCRIYYKFEGGNLSGSHKLNTAIAQAFYYKQAGATRLTTGTGAGQWGTAIAAACQMLGLECRVFMVRSSYHAKPYRKTIMEMLGATVLPCPSDSTEVGRAELATDPESGGSIPLASAEALECTAEPETYFSTGSAETYALLHQTVVGLEAQEQLAAVGDPPDVVLGSLGAGSGVGGLALPFLGATAHNERPVRVVAIEPSACPKLTRGRYAYDFSDLAGVLPLQKMYTLGHTFVVPRIHAGGLRYHGTAKLISALYYHQMIEAVAYPQRSVFETAVAFAQVEGVLPAPESAHALHGAVVEAQRTDGRRQSQSILLGISGHGLFDMAAYQDFHDGVMVDSAATEEQISESLACLPQQP